MKNITFKKYTQRIMPLLFSLARAVKAHSEN